MFNVTGGKMEPSATAPFTGAQIQQLKESWGTMERIDPCATAYGGLIKLLDSMPLHLLKQIATADIRFVSVLAGNRVRRQEAK
jgi:hypothetical protein